MLSLPPVVPPVVILTGAGISAESGLGTFRDLGGLWSQIRLEDVATPEAFAADPAYVQSFYNARREKLKTAQPNAAHAALADLERHTALDNRFLLVTQNVDDLHERAGSRALIHMHGELLKSRCLSCGHIAGCEALDDQSLCLTCKAVGKLRPHVVWFGEMPLGMDRIDAALARARTFISIGTSGVVYPAAGFVAQAKRHGALTIELNLEPSDGAALFDYSVHGRATEIVHAFVDHARLSLSAAP
jgi:NAD-dependent deacetylase